MKRGKVRRSRATRRAIAAGKIYAKAKPSKCGACKTTIEKLTKGPKE